MATSHTDPTPRRRPPGDREALTGSTTPQHPSTPTSTHEPAPRHPDARGTPPEAPPPSTPPDDPAPLRPPRRRRTTGDRRTSIDDKTREAIQAAAARLVADAPPLSQETRERLAALLSTTTYRPATRTTRARRAPP